MALAALAGVLIGLLFLASGLIVNAVQLCLMLLVLPFSRNAYRRMNAALTASFWSQMVFLVEWWGCLKITVFTDPETWGHIGKESAIVMANHRSDVDWAVGWVLAQRGGCLGTTRALMKSVVKYLPVIGWSMWFSEYVFLARDWAKDQELLKRSYEKLRDFPLPFWLALFVEGTRYTPQKLEVAQEFARQQGLPIPRNTLVPRTKGFVMSVECLRCAMPAILDMTIVIPDGVATPTFAGFFARQKSEIHVHIERVLMSTLPSDSEGIAKWCRDSFLRKDELLEEHKKINSFDPKLLLPMQPSKWPIFHTIFWSSLVLAGAYGALVRHSGSLVPDWETLAVLGLLFLAAAGVLQLLIFFTKSEYSTPLRAPKARPVKQQHQQQQPPAAGTDATKKME